MFRVLRRSSGVLAGSCLVGLVACHATPLRVAAVDDMDRVRQSAGAREGARLAPEAYARAEQERDLAVRAHAAGDEVGATLHAERATAAYGRAFVVARLAGATIELADATKALDDLTTQAQALEASRDSLQRQAEELEQHVRAARD